MNAPNSESTKKPDRDGRALRSSDPRTARSNLRVAPATVGSSSDTPRSVDEQGTSPLTIQVDGVSYSYGKTKALDDLSLDVPRASLFALLGRNGAGKSSLVNCLMGFSRPKAGSIAIHGVDSWKHRDALMNEVALVPETPNVPPSWSPKQAAAFCSRVSEPGRFDSDFFDGLLDESSISTKKSFRSFSRGQKNQITLALALAARPSVLILDDPTLGLDAVARQNIYGTLIDYQTRSEVTVFMTTHDLAAVDGLATHVGFLQQGQLVECGEVGELKERYRLAALHGGLDAATLPGTVVRTKPTAFGHQVLLSLAEPSPDALTDEPWAVPTVEELFLALLHDEPFDDSSRDVSAA